MMKKAKWAVLAVILGGYFLAFKINFTNPDMILGVSFDPAYAEYLGLPADEVYKTILDDWKFRYLRVSAPWDGIEAEPGKYDFSKVDWLLDEAQKRGAKVIVAVGNKTPRWPECHEPAWAKKIERGERAKTRERYIAAVVNRYKNHPVLEMWQVENEPFLPFGDCERVTLAEFKSELALVKSLDSGRPTFTTDSGELSTWRRTAQAADYFGTTLYRVVWNKYLGYVSYDWLPASFYRFKLWLVGRNHQTAFVSELQAEPWIPDQRVEATPLAEQYRSMNLDRLKKNINYARRIGLPRSYLWGAEWWVWLRASGHEEIPEYIRQLPKG